MINSYHPNMICHNFTSVHINQNQEPKETTSTNAKLAAPARSAAAMVAPDETVPCWEQGGVGFLRQTQISPGEIGNGMTDLSSGSSYFSDFRQIFGMFH